MDPRADTNVSAGLVVRSPGSIYRASGVIRGGTFEGRWHFSFDQYRDLSHLRFGNLRVLNDNTLSPGAVWPLHPHTQNEGVTYVAEGEFRHEDERGLGGVLHPGGVQHTTVGKGMVHSEINNRPDSPMRFIQIWFIPDELNLTPSVEQREVERRERTNRWLPLVSSHLADTPPLRAEGSVLASFLERGQTADILLSEGKGLYLYVLDGGPVTVDGLSVPALGAAERRRPGRVSLRAEADTELIGIEVSFGKDGPKDSSGQRPPSPAPLGEPTSAHLTAPVLVLALQPVRSAPVDHRPAQKGGIAHRRDTSIIQAEPDRDEPDLNHATRDPTDRDRVVHPEHPILQ